MTLEGAIPEVSFHKLGKGDVGRIKYNARRLAADSNHAGALSLHRHEPLPPNQIDPDPDGPVFLYPGEFYLIAKAKTKKESVKNILTQYRNKIDECKKFAEENGIIDPKVAVTCRLDIESTLVDPEAYDAQSYAFLVPEGDFKKLQEEGPFYYSHAVLGIAVVSGEPIHASGD